MTELVADRPPVEEVEAALSAEFGVRPGEATVAERVLLDTFDGLLRGAGLGLRWETGWLWLFEGDDTEPLAIAEAPEPAGPVLLTGLPPGELRDALSKVVEARALLPLVRLSVSRQPLSVLDSLEKTVARVSVESPVLLPEPGRPKELSTRLRLLGVRGYDGELRRAARLLRDSLGAQEPRRSLFDEALLAAGRAPEGVGSKVEVPLWAGERADEAAVRVLRELLEVIEVNLPGTLADVDPEFLHDLRVSVRRTRAVQRQLKQVFAPPTLERMRAEFKWLQQETGPARDLDVHVLEFEALRALLPAALRDDIDPLLVALRRRRLAARAGMTRALRSGRAGDLRADWRAVLDSLVAAPAADRPDATRPIAELAGRRIRKLYRRMLEMGRRLGPDSPPEEFHELRKKGKELRYLLELFAQPLHDPEVVAPMVKALKGLQDVLGRHQDREVQIELLRDVVDDVAGLPGGPRALMAAGVLVDRLEADAAAARAEFAERFAAFAGKRRRRLVEKAFS